MTEKLLQFIWQFQYFNKQSLTTAGGEALQILHAGELNTNQGPDFLQARIVINDTTWAGTVELHIKASDWYRHHHDNDDRYSKVILHVVWNNDVPVTDSIGEPVTTLELQSRVPNMLLMQYEKWMQTDNQVPCKNNIAEVPFLTWQHWKSRLMIERLIGKCQLIEQHLIQTSNHWEEVFWRLLCRYIGGNINGVSFEQLAISLPLQILAKHKNQVNQLEALLIGQAGLLHKNFKEQYPQLLYREYQFLQKKYGLRVINLPPSFLRMRPGNFPSVRLAQLAMLIHKSHHLFSQIREAKSVNELRSMFDVRANDYWHYHYRFDEETSYLEKHVGSQMTDTIIINAVVPVLFAYASHVNDNLMKEKSMAFLEEMKAEENSIVKIFKSLRVECNNAFDSQALLQLKKEYCDAKRCLECSAGNSILKRAVL